MSEIKVYFVKKAETYFEGADGNLRHEFHNPKDMVMKSDHDLAMRKKDKEIEMLRGQRNGCIKDMYENRADLQKMEAESLDAEITSAVEGVV